MSARLLKKVLNEQRPPLHHHLSSGDDGDEDSDVSIVPVSRPNLFHLLDDGDDSTTSDQEKDTVADEISDGGSENLSVAKVGAVAPSVKSKKHKNKKNKKKIKGGNLEPERYADDFLESLSLENRSSSSTSQHVRAYGAESKLIKVNVRGKMKKHILNSILLIDPKYLRAENELRRIFGSKVVSSFERVHSSVNNRNVHGGRRGLHSFKRTLLVTPPEHWPRWDGSLSMDLLETKDGINYFRYVHSSSYGQAQRSFEAAKAIHDLNGITSILLHHPYHLDSLITLADYFKFTGEHQMSSEATARCLYAMECAWHPLFSNFQNLQLKYTHDSNKPFFVSLFNHMKNMNRRSCHRSALEVCKLLLSLDSDDPMGSLFCIDYYALRAEEYAWLEQFADEYTGDNSLWLYPNFAYSLAISRFYLERGESRNGKATSQDLMKQALLLHPPVLKKLVEKVPLKDRMWTSIIEHSFFRSEQIGNPSLDHLITIYVERSYLLWRLPDLQKLLLDSAASVIETLIEQSANDWACVRKEAFSSNKNEYSHLMVSDFSDSAPTMPPDNLNDFVVDPRGGMLDEQFPNVHQDNNVPDVANRNAIAVLFESMLPWVRYGTGEDEFIPDDQPNDH